MDKEHKQKSHISGLQQPGPSQARLLFVTDLDGTLLNDQRQLSAKDLAALAEVRRRGGRVAIATGRSTYSFYSQLRQLGYRQQDPVLPVDYLIFSTGAGILHYPSGQLLWSRHLPPSLVSKLAVFLDSQEVDFMVHRAIPDTHHFIARQWGAGHPDFHRRIARYQEFGSIVSGDWHEKLFSATEVLCVAEAATAHGLSARLRQFSQEISVIEATSPLDGKSIWVEIFAHGVSKSMATDWLCRQLGIDCAQVGAVGNDYNDADLLSYSRHGFMVANGPAVLREHYQPVASNNEAGVSEAVGCWLHSLGITGNSDTS